MSSKRHIRTKILFLTVKFHLCVIITCEWTIYRGQIVAKFFLVGIIIYSDFETVLNFWKCFWKKIWRNPIFVTSDEIIFETNLFNQKQEIPHRICFVCKNHIFPLTKILLWKISTGQGRSTLATFLNFQVRFLTF